MDNLNVFIVVFLDLSAAFNIDHEVMLHRLSHDVGEVQNVLIVVLLDLSAVFDTVDHEVMLHRLSHDVGLDQNALDWFRSYLTDRVQSVHICGATSPARHLACEVPQGSVICPQLFSIYAAPIAKIIRKNNLISHFYTDDTQIYTQVKHLQKDIAAAVVGVEECVAEISMWTSSNFLKLNDSKTEVIVFGSAQQLKKTELNTIRNGYCLVTVTHDVRNLGVQFDVCNVSSPHHLKNYTLLNS